MFAFQRYEEPHFEPHFISCSYLAVMGLIAFRLRSYLDCAGNYLPTKSLYHANLEYLTFHHLGCTPDARSIRGCAADYENHP